MKEMLKEEILEKKVPENEIKVIATRCSKPGGQNVNKGMMGREARWNPQKSEAYTDEEIRRICEKVKLTQKGEIVIRATTFKSAERNREDAIERLNEKIGKALEKEEERIPTKPKKAAKERRLEEKKRQSEKKKARQKIKYW